jgi:hypothetical protein
MVFAAPDDPVSAITDPGFLLNLGAVGFFLTLFLADKIHSQGALRRVEAAAEEARNQRAASLAVMQAQHEEALKVHRQSHESAMRLQKEAHDSAMQRMDDHVRQLIVERDAANKERNEAVGVMRDFTLAAGAILHHRPPWGDGPPPLGGAQQ